MVLAFSGEPTCAYARIKSLYDLLNPNGTHDTKSHTNATVTTTRLENGRHNN